MSETTWRLFEVKKREEQKAALCVLSQACQKSACISLKVTLQILIQQQRSKYEENHTILLKLK